MRTPLCSLPLAADSLARVRHCVRGIGGLLGWAPLARARWLTAVSIGAHATVQAGGGTLTLLLDDDSPDCAGPALAAEFLRHHAAPGPAASAWDPESAALVRAGELVDHLAAPPGAGVAAVLTLESGLPGSAPSSVGPALRARIDALLQQPAPEPLEALAQQDEDTFELLAAADKARSELVAARSAHAEAMSVLAHDLRSPLLTLNLSLEMLRIKPHSPAELEERREVMKRQADQLKALATGLVTAAGPGRAPPGGAAG